MTQREQFEGHSRARIGKSGSRSQKLVGFVVLLGAGFLVFLVLAGSLDAPPEPAAPIALSLPTPAAETPTPTPQSRPRQRVNGEHLYLVSRSTTIEEQRVQVLDAVTGEPRYTIDDGRDLALSPNGTILFVLHSDGFAAYNTQNGERLWWRNLSGVDAPQLGGPSPIVVSPDGATVGVITQRALPNGSNETYPTLQLLDAASGWRSSRESRLAGWNGRVAPFFSADGASLYVPVGDSTLTLISLRTGQEITTKTLDQRITSALLGAIGDTIYVVSDGSPTTNAQVQWLNARTLNLERTDDLPLAAAVRVTPLVALSPDDRTLAVRLMLPPVTNTALKMSNELLTFNPNNRGVWTSIALDQEITALSFGPRTSTLYLAQAPVGVNQGDTLARLPANETVPIPIITLANERVMRLIAAPYGYEQPHNERPIVPNPLEILPSPFDERSFTLPDTAPFPQPYAVPSTRTEVITINLGLPSGTADAPSYRVELAPDNGRIIVPTERNNVQLIPDVVADGIWVEPPSYVAWVGVDSATGFDVVAIGRNGDQTPIAHNVQATIARPNAPPLLLIRIDNNAWGISDPLTQSGTMFQTDTTVRWQNCVLAPDQQRVACQGLSTLLILNLVDSTTQEISYGLPITPFSWTDSGIYSSSDEGNTRTVWRVDPNMAQGNYEWLLQLAENEIFVVAPARGTAGDRLIYTDDATYQLQVRDLSTNTERIVLQDALDLAGLTTSPDGRYAAYLRPQTDTTYDLMVADLVSETQQVWASNQPFVPCSLIWNAASTRLAYRIIEPADSPQRERLVVQSLPDGDQIGYFPLPGHTVAGMGFGSADQVIAVIYEDGVADLATLAANGQFGRVRAAVPLNLSQPTLLYVP